MNKIEKYLQRLSRDERERIVVTIDLLVLKDWRELNVKKLKGYRDIFRVRMGAHRIIFRQNKEQVRILAIDRRTEKTYEREF